MTLTDKQTAEVGLSLGWPHADLSPNARVHWGQKSRASKAARHEAGWAMRREFKGKPGWQRVAIEMVFCPPDNRRRDLDNLIASMKPAADGIADAIGVDDSLFQTTYRMGEPVKGGAVLVTVRAA